MRRASLPWTAALVLAFSALASAMAGSPAETFSATASMKPEGEDAATTAPVKIAIDRLSTEAERTTVMNALKTGGTHAVREVLAKMKDIGTIEVGERRIPVKYAYASSTGSGRILTVATAEPILHIGAGLPDAKPKAGYDLAVALLILDANGGGHGELAPAAKVKTNEAGSIVIEDYGADKVWLKGIAKAR